MERKAEELVLDSGRDPHDVGLLAASLGDEIDFFFEKIQEQNQSFTYGDKQVMSVLSVAKDHFQRSSNTNEIKEGVKDLISKLNTINSKFAPALANKFWSALKIFNDYPVTSAIKICQGIRKVFATPEFRTDSGGDAYQSTSIGIPGPQETAMPNTNDDNQTMETNTNFPKSPELKSNNLLVDMNSKVHEVYDLINQANQKAKTLQVSLAEYSGSNTDTKIQLVSSIGKLIRRFEQNMDMASEISTTITQRLKG